MKTAVIGFLLPAILLFGVVAATAGQETSVQKPTGIPVTLSPAPVSTTAAVERIYLPVLQGEEVVNMDLEEYLIGVLLSEIPASFNVKLPFLIVMLEQFSPFKLVKKIAPPR